MALQNALSIVGNFNGGFPAGLATIEGAALVLNALLAHDIYINVLAVPFASVNNENSKDALEILYCGLLNLATSESTTPEQYLESEQNIHSWRSDASRLFTPTSADHTAPESGMLKLRNDTLRQVAGFHATRFYSNIFNSFFMDTYLKDSGYILAELENIYFQAARMSYQLWTRREVFRCYKLADYPGMRFDISKPGAKPHPSIQPELHPDQLYGRPIEMFIQPLLEICGTAQGENYREDRRVLMPAEVWFGCDPPAGNGQPPEPPGGTPSGSSNPVPPASQPPTGPPTGPTSPPSPPPTPPPSPPPSGDGGDDDEEEEL